MAPDSPDPLEGLAAKVDNEFASHRQSDGFKTISLVIDTSTPGRSTLIIHIDGKNAESLANEVEAFLTENSAHTQREFHSETDIRVLATLER